MLPIAAGIYSFKSLKREGILILLLVISGSIPQIVRGVFGRRDFIYFFYNANIPLELFIVYQFFKLHITEFIKQRSLQASFLISCVTGIVLMSVYSFQHRFFNEWVCMNNLFFTGWTLMLMIELYQRDDQKISTHVPLFWFIIGLFLYSSCTAIIFSLWNYIRANENTLLNNIWILHDIFNVLMYVAFTCGILLYNLKKYRYE